MAELQKLDVVSIIDWVCEDMCGKYCKYTKQVNAALDGEAEEPEACKHCPLDMLR